MFSKSDSGNASSVVERDDGGSGVITRLYLPYFQSGFFHQVNQWRIVIGIKTGSPNEKRLYFGVDLRSQTPNFTCKIINFIFRDDHSIDIALFIGRTG